MSAVSSAAAAPRSSAATLLTEFAITMADFEKVDRMHRLLPGVLINHAVMGIVYGTFLAFFVPELPKWSRLQTGS
jgi:hypothetical protein